MRKTVTIFTLLLITFLSACSSTSSKSPEEEIIDIINEIQNAESYTLVSTINAFGNIQLTEKLDYINGYIEESGGLFDDESTVSVLIDGYIQYEEEDCIWESGWYVDGVYREDLSENGYTEMYELYDDEQFDWDMNEICEIIIEPELYVNNIFFDINTIDGITYSNDGDILSYSFYSNGEDEDDFVGNIRVTLEKLEDSIRIKIYLEDEIGVTQSFTKINDTVVLPE